MKTLTISEAKIKNTLQLFRWMLTIETIEKEKKELIRFLNDFQRVAIEAYGGSRESLWNIISIPKARQLFDWLHVVRKIDNDIYFSLCGGRQIVNIYDYFMGSEGFLSVSQMMDEVVDYKAFIEYLAVSLKRLFQSEPGSKEELIIYKGLILCE